MRGLNIWVRFNVWLGMFKVSFCTAAIDDDIAAMEIETLLHSGVESRWSSIMGVFVFRHDDLQKSSYLDALRAERDNQVFHFLAVLGVSSIEFIPHGQISVKSFETPSDGEIEASGREIKATLTHLGYPSDEIVPADMIDDFKLRRYGSRINVLRRLDESNFLLKRLQSLKDRYEKVVDYVNLQRTCSEELDAVYKQLFQKARLEHQGIEDINLRALNLAVRVTYNQPVSLKLIVPHHMRGDSILNWLLAQPNPVARRIPKFREFVVEMQNRYARRIREYSRFLYDFPLPVAADEHDILLAVEQVLQRRRQVAKLYEHFRFPYPSLGDPTGAKVAPLFYIYIYDPEERGYRLFGNGRPIENRVDAMQFYSNVVLSFDRMPRMLYSGLLQNVVLFKHVVFTNYHSVEAEVSFSGREMAIIDCGETLFSLESTVRHECGHVFDCKLNLQLRNKLEVIISARFTPQIQKCLTLFAQISKVVDNIGFTNSNKHNKQVAIVANHLLTCVAILKVPNGRADIIRKYGNAHLDEIERELALLEQREWHLLYELRDTRHLIEERTRAYHRFSLTTAGDDSVEFTSFYAAWNAAEEAAELIQQLVEPRLRAALFVEAHYNTVKRTKIELALEVFADGNLARGEVESDMAHRVATINGWKLELEMVTKHVSTLITIPGRYCVVLVSEKGSESFNLLNEVNAFVEKMTVEGNRVSFIHLLRQDGAAIDMKVMQRSVHPNGAFDEPIDRYKMKAGIVFFGIDEAALEDMSIELKIVLKIRKVDFDGRPALENFKSVRCCFYSPLQSLDDGDAFLYTCDSVIRGSISNM